MSEHATFPNGVLLFSGVPDLTPKEVRAKVVANGWAALPLNGKRPVINVWQRFAVFRGPLPSADELAGWTAPGTGIGCGSAVAVDIDFAADADMGARIKAVALEVFGETPFERVGKPPKVMLVYRAAEAIPKQAFKRTDNSGDGIDIQGVGSQFVAFGIHPDTGEPYQWTGPKSPLDAAPDAAPEITAAQVGTFLARVREFCGLTEGGGRKGRGGESATIVRDAEGKVKDGREGYLTGLVYDVACEMFTENATNITERKDELTDKVWQRFEAEARTDDGQWTRRDAEIKVEALLKKVAAGSLKLRKRYVDDGFETTDKGVRIAKSQANIRHALQKLGVRLRHNSFTDRIMVEGLDGFGPELDDKTANELWLLIDRRFGIRPTRELFDSVVLSEALQNRFHPVWDYLDGLTWDGTPRLDRWLTAYAGAEETPYTRAVGALTLIAAVRRVRKPGVKFDEMLVLESDQGKDKSSALACLAVREDWFSDHLSLSADPRVVIETISGRWIVEAAELKGMRKGEVEHVKAMLSRQVDRARLAYGRQPTNAPRQCVFIGTTNSAHYLNDGTGNRRFWPVRVRPFNLEALRRDRDQLWAEAAAREAQGESIRLPPELWSAAAAEQEAREVGDPFYDELARVLDGREGKISARDVWAILDKPIERRTQADNDRMGAAIVKLGFERKQRRFGGGPEWGYVKGDGEKRIVVSRGEPPGHELSVDYEGEM